MELVCADAGPWVCEEDGCPSETLGCAELASLNACASMFADVWAVPPDGTNGRTVGALCPRTCGRCPPPSACNVEQLDPSAYDGNAIAQKLQASRAPVMLRNLTAGFRVHTLATLLALRAELVIVEKRFKKS